MQELNKLFLVFEVQAEEISGEYSLAMYMRVIEICNFDPGVFSFDEDEGPEDLLADKLGYQCFTELESHELLLAHELIKLVVHASLLSKGILSLVDALEVPGDQFSNAVREVRRYLFLGEPLFAVSLPPADLLDSLHNNRDFFVKSLKSSFLLLKTFESDVIIKVLDYIEENLPVNGDM